MNPFERDWGKEPPPAQANPVAAKKEPGWLWVVPGAGGHACEVWHIPADMVVGEDDRELTVRSERDDQFVQVPLAELFREGTALPVHLFDPLARKGLVAEPLNMDYVEGPGAPPTNPPFVDHIAKLEAMPRDKEGQFYVATLGGGDLMWSKESDDAFRNGWDAMWVKLGRKAPPILVFPHGSKLEQFPQPGVVLPGRYAYRETMEGCSVCTTFQTKAELDEHIAKQLGEKPPQSDDEYLPWNAPCERYGNCTVYPRFKTKEELDAYLARTPNEAFRAALKGREGTEVMTPDKAREEGWLPPKETP